jgi:branched-chain amino acid transport system ATP-binding protein
MLELADIETSYGASQVLFGIGFKVQAGEVVTLLGRNGMGKTTTVRSIMGLIKPRAGTVRFEGQSLTGLPAYRVATAGIGPYVAWVNAE